MTYLRAALRSRWRALAAVATIALASVLSPAAALPRIETSAWSALHAWHYFCSMLFGAAPFLAGGGLVAAAVRRAPRWSGIALPVVAVLSPGCDCAMNSYALDLAQARPALAAFALLWGSCCNPVALFSTAAVLGPRLLGCRIASGFVAAALTALAWSRAKVAVVPCCADARTGDFWNDFSRATSNGLRSFSIAAAASAFALVALSHGAPIGGAIHGSISALAAALLGAIISPCSTGDALLARVLFARAPEQIAFIVASQCLDVRQFALLRKYFGAHKTALAFACSALACGLGYWLARP